MFKYFLTCCDLSAKLLKSMYSFKIINEWDNIVRIRKYPFILFCNISVQSYQWWCKRNWLSYAENDKVEKEHIANAKQYLIFKVIKIICTTG